MVNRFRLVFGIALWLFDGGSVRACIIADTFYIFLRFVLLIDYAVSIIFVTIIL